MRPAASGYLSAVGTMLIVAATATASGQVFEVTAGASTSYGAAGGGIIIHGKAIQTSLGAGLIQGHFAAGGSSFRTIPGGTLTLGQQSFRMDLPTDVFEASHLFFGTGLGVVYAPDPRHTLSGFAGLSSQDGGTPLFGAALLQQKAAFARWARPLTSDCGITWMALLSTKSAMLQSVACELSPSLEIAGTLGFGAGAPYLAGSFTFERPRLHLRASFIDAGETFDRGNDVDQPTPEPVRENLAAEVNLTREWTVSGAHQHFLTLGTATRFVPAAMPAAPVHSSLDTASAQYQRGGTGTSVTVLHSTFQEAATPGLPFLKESSDGVSAAFHHSFGRVLWSESLLHAFGDHQAGSTILINGVGVTVNPHLKLTEDVNVTAQGTTFSHGGTLLTNYSSFEVDYQFFYLASEPAHPFQQAMVFDAQVRLPHDLALHAGSNLGSEGRLQYTFQLSTLFARNEALPEPISQGGLGINLLRGRVVDMVGQPVEGAVLLIGSQRVYSDSDGFFFFRERRPTAHEFHVLTDEFLEMGAFEVRDAPVLVHTSTQSQALVIRVDRRRGGASETPLPATPATPGAVREAPSARNHP